MPPRSMSSNQGDRLRADRRSLDRAGLVRPLPPGYNSALAEMTRPAEDLMSHAEALHPLHPAAGATGALVGFVGKLSYPTLGDEVRHYARRHLLDTVGVMIAGAGGEVATRAEAMLVSLRP